MSIIVDGKRGAKKLLFVPRSSFWPGTHAARITLVRRISVVARPHSYKLVFWGFCLITPYLLPIALKPDVARGNLRLAVRI